MLLQLLQREVIYSTLFPVQLGVAIPGATELIGRAADFLLGSPSSGKLLLQVDLRNAFNSVNRAQLLQRVRETAPGFSQWAEFIYGQPAPLILTKGQQLLSQEGVQQGDPLGPLLFALSIHP